MATWSLQDAKNKFSRVVVEALKGEPQRVTRHGKQAVVVIAAAEYERLSNADATSAPSFTEFLLSLPEGGDIQREDVAPREFPI